MSMTDSPLLFFCKPYTPVRLGSSKLGVCAVFIAGRSVFAYAFPIAPAL